MGKGKVQGIKITSKVKSENPPKECEELDRCLQDVIIWYRAVRELQNTMTYEIYEGCLFQK